MAQIYESLHEKLYAALSPPLTYPGIMSEPATILVADDEAGQRTILEMLLSLEGYEIVATEDGRQTLEYLKDHTPNLAILDVNMPFVDGIEICDRMRRLSRLRSVPVIILTGLEDKRIETMATMAKADKVVRKPLQGKDFRQVVRELLNPAPDAV